MPQPQTAICPDTGAFGLFLTLTLRNGRGDTVAKVLAQVPDLTLDLAAQMGEPALYSAVGIGAVAWPQLYKITPPPGLVPFLELRSGSRLAPSTPADLFIHVHSPRHDANFALAHAIMTRLSGLVELVEEVHGFKHMGGRDLTGFVDGTENPKGVERAEVGLVSEELPDFIGGSFVSIQRYVHNFSRWDAIPVVEQEGVIGRTKADDLELDVGVKPKTAHIARVVVEENGTELEILRHSMPYGTTSEAGLYFVAYARSPHPFRTMLESMVLGDAEGHYDRLLDFTRAVTGAAFFAPSVDMLKSLSLL